MSVAGATATLGSCTALVIPMRDKFGEEDQSLTFAGVSACALSLLRDVAVHGA